MIVLGLDPKTQLRKAALTGRIRFRDRAHLFTFFERARPPRYADGSIILPRLMFPDFSNRARVVRVRFLPRKHSSTPASRLES